MTAYSTLQQDQLKKIGANLQESRESQSKSIDDIAVQTYIRPQLIRAIESGEVEDLPQPIFVQGFIRRYAEALGLDGKTLSKQFPVHSIPDTPRPNPNPAAKPFGSEALANPVITDRPLTRTPPRPELRPVVQAEPRPKSRPDPKPIARIDSRPMPTVKPATPESKQPVATPAATSAAKTAATPAATSATEPAVTPAPELAATSVKESKPVESTARTTAKDTPFGEPPFKDSDLERQTYGENGLVSAPKSASKSAIELVPKRPNSEESGDGRNPVPYVFASILAVAVVGAIALLFTMGGDSESQQAQVESTPEVTEPETPPPAPEPEPEPEPEPVSPSAGSDAPVAVSVNLTGESWVSVRVDGNRIFDGLMTNGTAELYEGQSSVYISVGNAGAVELSYNGSEPEVAGPSGAVREFTYSPQ